MNNMSTSSSSIAKRLNVTFGTGFIIAICSIIFLQSLAIEFMYSKSEMHHSAISQIYAVCINIQCILEKIELHRLYFHAFWHVNLLHLVVNMLSLVSIGRTAEKSVGTLTFLNLCHMLVGLSSLLYFVIGLSTIYLLKAAPTIQSSFYSSCTVGFSGVLFGLLVIDCRKNPNAQLSLFNIVSVPARVYPLILIILLEILIPDTSLLGHVSGALAGYLISLTGERFMRHRGVRWLEESYHGLFSRHIPGFQVHPSISRINQLPFTHPNAHVTFSPSLNRNSSISKPLLIQTK